MRSINHDADVSVMTQMFQIMTQMFQSAAFVDVLLVILLQSVAAGYVQQPHISRYVWSNRETKNFLDLMQKKRIIRF